MKKHDRLRRFSVGDVVIYLVIGLFTLACVIPFWYVIVSSFSQMPGFTSAISRWTDISTSFPPTR